MARRRSYIAGGVFLLGVAVLMSGAVLQLTVVGIIGFVVMLGSAYVALSSWRGQNHAVEEPRPGATHAPFTVVDGGRAKKRSPKTRSQHTMMERFEERWRRRRDQQNGF